LATSSEWRAKLLNRRPLNTSERAQAKVAMTAAINAVLLTGSGRSVLEAIDTSSTTLPAFSKLQYLRGMHQLQFDPPSSRDVLTNIISELGLLVREDGDRTVLPWLLTGIKFGYPAERYRVYQGLLGVHFSDEEVTSTVKNLFDSIVAQGHNFEEKAAEITRDLASQLPDGRWPVAILRELATHPRARLNSVWRNLEYLSDGRLIQNRDGSGAETPQIPNNELVTYLNRPELPLVQTALFVMLLRGDSMADHIIQIWNTIRINLEALTNESDTLLKKLRNASTRFLGNFGSDIAIENILTLLFFGRALLPLSLLPEAKLLTEKLKTAKKMARSKGISERLRILVRNSGFQVARDEELIAGLRVVKFSSNLSAGFELGRSEYMFPFKTTLYASYARDWLTDEDEFGLLIVKAAGSIELVKMPLSFPVKRSGANGAKRYLKSICSLGDEALLKIESPFGDEGWGKKNYIVSFNATERKWYNWFSTEHYRELKRIPIEPGIEKTQLNPCWDAEVMAEKIREGSLHFKEKPLSIGAEPNMPKFPLSSKENPPDWAHSVVHRVLEYLNAPYAEWAHTPPARWFIADELCVVISGERAAIITKLSTIKM
jgi:hypothetical protein